MQEKYIFKPDGRVIMVLPGKQFKPHRQIGRVIGNTYHTERGRNSIFRSIPGGAIGLPLKLLSSSRFDFIEVTLEPDGKILRSSTRSVLMYGTVLSYSTHQLECQILMPIPLFGREPERSAEPSLFDELATPGNTVINRKRLI